MDIKKACGLPYFKLHTLKFLASAGFLFPCVFGASPAFATPQEIRITGNIFDSNGAPITTNRDFQIKAYDANTAGTLLWTSSVYNTPVNDGQYNLVVDSSTGSPSLIQRMSDMASTGEIWFEIDVDSGAANGVMDTPGTVAARMRAKGTLFSVSSITTDSLRNRKVATTAPTDGQVLKWSNGSQQWEPSADNGGTTYSAGTGLNLTVSTFSIANGGVDTAQLAADAVTSAKIADGEIVNADISTTAAIAHSKLANITSGQILVGNGSNVPTAVAVSGDATLANTGVLTIASGTIDSSKISDGSIANVDISSTAAIAHSKLASVTDGNILVGNGSNVPTSVAVSGDATLANTGALTIANNAITSAKINDGEIVNADISASAAIVDTKLATISTAGKISGGAIISGTIGGSTAINTSGSLVTGSSVTADGFVSEPTGTSSGNGGEIKLKELSAQGTSGVILRSPDALASDVTLTLPVDDGNANQVLQTDGSGNLSWVDQDGGVNFTWTTITGDTTATVNNGYIVNSASLVNITLPTTCNVGDKISVLSMNSGGWKVLQQNTGHVIHGGDFGTTTVGASGYIRSLSSSGRDSAELICIVQDDVWALKSQSGYVGYCTGSKTTYTFTGGDQEVVAPTGCSTLTVKAWGAGGGGGYDASTPENGGPGGFTHATVSVLPNERLTVVVGQAGSRNVALSGADSPGYGFGGVAYAGSTCSTGHGGGLSGVFRATPSQSSALVVAGGGGGASGYTEGGSGNDTTNSGGNTGYMNGLDGASSWRGAGGAGYEGGNLHTRSTDNATYPSGNGGTGYVTPGGTTVALQFTTEFSRTPPGTADGDYPGTGTSGTSAIGYGGLGAANGSQCNSSGHGAVVLEWSDE